MRQQQSASDLGGRRHVSRRFIRPLDLLFVTMMLVGLAWIYRRIIAGRVLAGGDLQMYFYPYWVAITRAVKSGHFPLWTPYLFTGVPLLANSQLGVLYPLNWPFWLLAAVSLLSPVSALHWCVLLHLAVAAVAAYILVRRQGYSPWSAALTGLVYAGGGFAGVHVEHLNQLQALAWLPFLFLPSIDLDMGHLGRFRLPSPGSVLAFAMILLAGHLQMVFIAMIGLASWYLPDVLVGSHRRRNWIAALGTWVLQFVPFGLAVVLVAAQLLPTIELALLSARGTGFDWRAAVSFSVPPWQLYRALLPPYLASPLLPEGVTYLGSAALLLAGVGLWRALRERDRWTLAWVTLAGVGLFLALGGYNPLYLLAVRVGIPGFAQFRAPARFLALYVLGGSVLAGVGLDAIHRRMSTAFRVGHGAIGSIIVVSLLLIGVGGELALAGEALPHAQATSPQAYTDLRPATAQMVAASISSRQAGRVPGRFLSMSQTLFELGDKAEISLAYKDVLDSGALWAYMVAAKQREVLAPNLPLAFMVPAVDGYDGGLLPLHYYDAFSRLFLPGGTLDGRLRENLSTLPETRWLDLLDVHYLLTDRTSDGWVDGILYDRQFQPTLLPGESLRVGWLPEDFTADALALLYEGGGGTVEVSLENGAVLNFHLPASDDGEKTHWIRWPQAVRVVGVSFRGQDAAAPLRLIGLSLFDSRLSAFYPLVLSNSYRLVHTGDVKIYEALTEPSRAFLVRSWRGATTDEDALATMRSPTFDPHQAVILSGGNGFLVQRGQANREEVTEEDVVRIVDYKDTRVVLEVRTVAPAYLVLRDAWYPSWRVSVKPVMDSSLIQSPDVPDQARRFRPVRADILFRAVPVEAGSWVITFEYVPRMLYIGIAFSLCGLLGFFLYACRVASA